MEEDKIPIYIQNQFSMFGKIANVCFKNVYTHKYKK